MTTARDSEAVRAARQQQFLDVISRDEAARRFAAALSLEPVGVEAVPLAAALGRVLAVDVVSPVDVPGFDRSNVDGFAVRSLDTAGAMEEAPRSLRLAAEVLPPGREPTGAVEPGGATTIATGGMLPRGADAVVMVEDTDLDESPDDAADPSGSPRLLVTRAVAAGQNVTFAGTDIARGETALRVGQVLTSRELGVLAAVGLDRVTVYRRPRVAVISTGDEIVSPGQPCPPGRVYDSNLAILCAAVTELGGEPVPLGVVADNEARLEAALAEALACDVVVLSGGTSKGAGDLSYRVVTRTITDPGIVAHGVALKPGKPICLAASGGKPVVILPGFPTSAVFTFHEFVAPVIRRLAGRPPAERSQVTAELPMKFHSERGRTEYLLVSLLRSPTGLAAYPIGKGSGSVTTFSHADGFITIDQHTEQLEPGVPLEVTLLGPGVRPAELVVIGSHCRGLDLILSHLNRRGLRTKSLAIGSQGGLVAAKRGECDLAGIHLFDPQTGEYNRPFLTGDLEWIPGYRRLQCVIHRPDDTRFTGRSATEAVLAALADPACTMINRNPGSGTRVLMDGLLGGARPAGYASQPRSHNAVAAAVAQGRADWGVAIDVVAREYGLATIPLQDECFDFVAPRARSGSEAVSQFRAALADPAVRAELAALGLRLGDATPGAQR
jgi:putative molybdopterin biosynthesis protein